jgi:hypothetical protein
MTQFALLYRSTPEAHHEALGTPERLRQSRTKWSAWIEEMKGKGQLVNVGMPLERTGKVVGGRSRAVTDGPYSETKEVLGGFSIIEAKDIADAARIASGCPVLERGGSVEVRPVLALDL